jgi:NADP-dependent 3-hydroxy acid dehydrogenase YdfG
MKQAVLMTGISSVIGAASTTKLAAAGYRVFGGARTPAKVTSIEGVELIQLDVREEKQVND